MNQKEVSTKPKTPIPPRATVINSKGRLKTYDVYNGIIKSMQSNVGELNIVVEVDGKQHFTSCSITNIFDMLHEYADKLTEGFNREVGIADAVECSENNS